MKTTLLLTLLLSTFSAQARTKGGAGYDQVSDGENAKQFITAIEAAGAKVSTDAAGNISLQVTNLLCPTEYELRTVPGIPGCSFTQTANVTLAINPSVAILDALWIGQIHGTIIASGFSHFSFNKVTCTLGAQGTCTFSFNQ